jgi:hypothetical protein
MNPSELKPESFARYPSGGRAFALEHIELLRQIPLSLLPLILFQIQRYDLIFPAERAQLLNQVTSLETMDRVGREALTQAFAAIALRADLKKVDWVNHPQQFSEHLTALLWQQHQIDRYHAAAEQYGQAMERISRQAAPPEPRWTFVLLGREASSSESALFRKLAPLGTLFTHIDPARGTGAIMAEAVVRAQRNPTPYGHWYIDGGEPLHVPSLTTVAYNRLVPAARKEFALLHDFSATQNRGDLAAVEQVTSYAASLSPEQIGLTGPADDSPLRQFEVDLLTKGAGCQIFSTTFVQWAARECLHRAQPITLVARFSTRQTMAPMNQLLDRDPLSQQQDVQGSLVDADMGAYYTWINQSRLPGSGESRFIAWWEDHDAALVVSPMMPRGTISTDRVDIKQLIDWLR